MSSRQRVSTNGKFEQIVGYSRAVRVQDTIFVSGTSGYSEDGSYDSDAYTQAKNAIRNVDLVLAKAGSSIRDVVRTRVFVKEDADWRAIAKAHQEAFGAIMPASTMLVCGFLDKGIIVEIEADAVVDGKKPKKMRAVTVKA
ncbi:MAG: RidA family protein [Nitrososphaerales archaeon]